jgi:hypothetical protein
MSTAGAKLRAAFVAASAAWAVAIPSAAAASAVASPAVGFYLFAAAVYAIGGAICHQLPDRSFFAWGRQLPVCARCVGIYAGAALMAAAFAAMRASRRDTPRWLATRASRRRAGVAAVVVNASTLAYEWTTGAAPSNAIRAVAGFTLGAVVAAFIVYDVD